MNATTGPASRDYGRFDELAEEFAARYRRGERPGLQEYIDRCPELADEIREMFPALVEVERAEEDVHQAVAPPPPGLFETMMFLPTILSLVAVRCRARAVRSQPPPGPAGAMNSTVVSGCQGLPEA